MSTVTGEREATIPPLTPALLLFGIPNSIVLQDWLDRPLALRSLFRRKPICPKRLSKFHAAKDEPAPCARVGGQIPGSRDPAPNQRCVSIGRSKVDAPLPAGR